MLRNTDLVSSRPVAHAAMANGQPLAAVPGTPLADLCRLSRPLVVNAENDATPIYVVGEEDPNSLSSLERQIAVVAGTLNELGEEPHGDTLRKVAELVSGKVSATLHYARNTVNPLVLEIVECAEAAKQDALSSRQSIPTIHMCEVPAIFNHAGLLSLLERHRTRHETDVPLSHEFATRLTTDLTQEELTAAVMTGTPLDAEIEKVLQEALPLADLVGGGYALTEYVQFNAFSGKNPFQSYMALVSFLFLMGVRSGRYPSVDFSALTGEERTAISAAINYYGHAVQLQIGAIASAIEANNIFICERAGEIYVNAQSYRAWLEESGGSPEALAMWFRTTPPAERVSVARQTSLFNNAAALAQLFEQRQTTDMAGDRIKALNAMNRVIRQKLLEALREVHAEDSAKRLQCLDRVNEYLDEHPYTLNVALDGYVLRVTCIALEREKSDVYTVLTTMRDLMAQDPEMTPKNAALFASIRLVSRWVKNQVGRATFA